MSKRPGYNPNILRNRTIVSGLMVFAIILTACGGGGNSGGPTPRATWEGCRDITPRAPVIVPAIVATEAMENLARNPVDASCVATRMPIIAETGTPASR